jgi:hypothetical protein
MTQKGPKLSPLIHLQALGKQNLKTKADLSLLAEAMKMCSRCRRGYLERVGTHRDSRNLGSSSLVIK